MPLPNFTSNPYVAPVTQSLAPQLNEAVTQKIAQYDANAEFSDVLAYETDSLLQKIAPFENDSNYARQVMNETRQNIQSWADKGDYENMTRDIRKGAREFSQKVAPLLQNQKNYSDYIGSMEELYKTGKINIDTFTKAKAASLSNYKGYDPRDPNSSLFKGFTPSPDINVSDKVNKYLEDWKADGGSRLVPQGDGSYVERKWESANEKEIAAAAQEFLMGDQEFTGYAQTQGAIGNQQRVESEFANAIRAGAKKYGFYKEDLSLSWMPEYAFDNKKALEIAQSLPMNPSSVTPNPGAVSIFKAQGLDVDDATGKVVLSSMIQKENGKFYKFTDDKGNPITKADYAAQATANPTALLNPAGGFSSAADKGYRRVEIPEDEATKFTIEANQELVNMAANRYLKEQLGKGNISMEGYLGDEKLTKAFLTKNASKFNNPAYLKETAKQYEEAIDNAANITSNKRWDISLIPGASSPEFTTLKDDDILANLTGQSVGILDTDLGGFRKGQRADLNSMIDKLQEDGFSLKSVRRLGPLEYNPYSNQPGMSYAATLEDKDGKKKTLEFAAGMNDAELQPVQNVYNMAYKGMSGDVPFHAPRSQAGQLNGRFRIRTSTELIGGKRQFVGFVEVLGPQGQKIKDARVPQDIPINQFGEVYQKFFAPQVLTKYLNPKYRPKPTQDGGSDRPSGN